MTRRRMEVSAEEEQILLGLRHERDIWNKAIADVIMTIQNFWPGGLTVGDREDLIKLIMGLRK